MTPEHELRRTPDNDLVCVCGYRPPILDEAAPIGKLWRAKAAVEEHVRALTAESPSQDETGRRSPEAPFHNGRDVKYPRAGVRQTADGQWLLTLWDGDRIVHVIDERDRKSEDRYTAFSQGWLTVGACRQSGTNLNGMAIA